MCQTRLYRAKEKMEARARAAQHAAAHPVDAETGRPWFAPATGRPPRLAALRQRQGLPVGEYLYGKWVRALLPHVLLQALKFKAVLSLSIASEGRSMGRTAALMTVIHCSGGLQCHLSEKELVPWLS